MLLLLDSQNCLISEGRNASMVINGQGWATFTASETERQRFAVADLLTLPIGGVERNEDVAAYAEL